MSQIGIERPKKSSIVYILQVMKSTDRLQKHELTSMYPLRFKSQPLH